MGLPGDDPDLGTVEPLAPETIRSAQRVTAAMATDADECRMLLAMLGIDGVGTSLCGTCGDPISRAANEGYNRRASGGRCGKCVVAAEKAVGA